MRGFGVAVPLQTNDYERTTAIVGTGARWRVAATSISLIHSLAEKTSLFDLPFLDVIFWRPVFLSRSIKSRASGFGAIGGLRATHVLTANLRPAEGLRPGVRLRPDSGGNRAGLTTSSSNTRGPGARAPTNSLRYLLVVAIRR